MKEEIQLKTALKQYFGFDTFKSNQEAIIKSLLEGKNVFVLMPTGGGKPFAINCHRLLWKVRLLLYHRLLP